MVDGTPKNTETVIVAFLIIFSVFLLCSGCTLRIEPLEKKPVKREQIHRHKSGVHRLSHQPSNGNSPTSIIGTDPSGGTRVTKSWMIRYRDLEKHYGGYKDDDREIKENKDSNTVTIGSGVLNHYIDMKRQSIDMTPSPTP